MFGCILDLHFLEATKFYKGLNGGFMSQGSGSRAWGFGV